MSIDIAEVSKIIRAVAPDCFIIVDGIQHAAHGALDIASYDIDAFTVSAYKAFSKHNYGFSWLSPRMSTLPHDHLDGSGETQWEMGTRDTSAYATFSEVVNYLDWLGTHFTESDDRRTRLLAAGEHIVAHEHHLVETMLNGTVNHPGLRDMEKVYVLGGLDNPQREGLVSLAVDGVPSAEVVSRLSEAGIRTHVRKNDYFSGNVLNPLGMETCVRVSMCHYNSTDEILKFLRVIGEIAA